MNNIDVFKKILIENYFNANTDLPENYLYTPEGQKDLEDHLYARTNVFKNYLAKFNTKHTLSNKKILEIGCGTGATTLALLDYTTNIHSIDIDEKIIKIAEKRLELLAKKNVCWYVTNNIQTIKESNFDIIIFPASIEHMTYHERIKNLYAAWEKLNLGGHLIILEAPNRLWYYDHHTSFMPFYLWLPEDLALRYSSKSPRTIFSKKFLRSNDLLALMRWGRGFSYHEIELALNIPIKELKISFWIRQSEDMGIFKHFIFNLISVDSWYKRIMRRITNKSVHPCFFEPFLNFSIQKIK